MTQYIPDEKLFTVIQGQVVVLTGGATGIGAATVRLLAQHGASVVFGDLNTQAGQALADEHDTVTFAKCDVTQYAEIYSLFDKALQLHGKVNHAFSCAGIFEQGNWFDPDLTVESVKTDTGNTAVIDVNIVGTMMFARIAVPFLKHQTPKGEDRSLILMSSVNAFRESPGIYLYQSSKHAVHGLLRSCRKPLFERDGIRVNAICPGMTDSPMTQNLIKPFKEAGLFWQPAESIATFALGIFTATTISGKAFYIEGGDGWEFEDSFWRTQPQWLGEEPARRLRANVEAVSKGALVNK